MKATPDPKTKPYYKCLTCKRFRNECGGIPTRSLDLEDWCAYMRIVKEMFKMTNAKIAEAADVSVATIERIVAMNIDSDIRRATARRIELAVIGDVGTHTCYLDYNDDTHAERIGKLTEENAALKEKLEKIDEIHRNDVRVIRSEHKEETTFLKEVIRGLQEQMRRQHEEH